MTSLNNCEPINDKLSGYLDNELTQQESQRIALHIEQCDCCRQTYNELKALKNAVSHIDYADMEQEKLDDILNDMTTHRIQDASWVAIMIGCSIIAIILAYQFLAASSVPFIMKLLISLVSGGCIGLFISVLRHRLIISKTDKYNKVKL
jgi:anti-sigma factor RsiW